MVVDTPPGTTVAINVVRDKQPLTLHVRVEPLELDNIEPMSGPSPVR